MSRSIEEVTWGKLRKEVFALNSVLATIIDDLDPDDDYTFIKSAYPFGSEILKRSQLQLPISLNDIQSFDSHRINSRIKQKLAYCLGGNPVALVLKNSVELFLALENRIMPFAIIPQGQVFGTWRFLDVGDSYCPKTSIWGLSAGARSLFMLPKISQTLRHNKLLNKFSVSTDTPKNLLEHWYVFKSLASHEDFGESWTVELLYFTGKWFQHREDKKWKDFYYYLLNNAWQGSGYWRNQFVWELIFSIIEEKRRIKPPAYLTKLVKHLLTLATGSVPGFSPALDDSLAPVRRLQQIYVEDYGLKDYIPIIMQPAYFSLRNLKSRPIYYSLQFPTTLEFSLKTRERTTALTDLYLLKSLQNKYIVEILSQQLQVQDTLLYDAAMQVAFDYFHSASNNYTDVRDTKEIPLEDYTFLKTQANYSAGQFPHKANFLNGCVRISHIDSPV